MSKNSFKKRPDTAKVGGENKNLVVGSLNQSSFRFSEAFKMYKDDPEEAHLRHITAEINSDLDKTKIEEY